LIVHTSHSDIQYVRRSKQLTSVKRLVITVVVGKSSLMVRRWYNCYDSPCAMSTM